MPAALGPRPAGHTRQRGDLAPPERAGSVRAPRVLAVYLAGRGRAGLRPVSASQRSKTDGVRDGGGGSGAASIDGALCDDGQCSIALCCRSSIVRSVPRLVSSRRFPSFRFCCRFCRDLIFFQTGPAREWADKKTGDGDLCAALRTCGLWAGSGLLGSGSHFF